MRHELWQLPATADSVAVARRVAREFVQRGGANEITVSEIVLCINEAVTNAVVHAYGDGTGEIEIEAFDEGGVLAISVRDFGVGIRPRIDSPGAGFGLSMIARLASMMTTGPASEDGELGTEIVMHFDVAAGRLRPADAAPSEKDRGSRPEATEQGFPRAGADAGDLRDQGRREGDGERRRDAGPFE
jgi:anti-sigma regulatory factor (Ser/Thr protein kinase)